MNEEILKLVNRANELLINKKRGSGVRYPDEVKNIVLTLNSEYKLSTHKICELIPVSHFSVRDWKANKNKYFKRIKMNNYQPVTQNNKIQGQSKSVPIMIILISVQVLLLSLQLFFQSNL